MKRASTFAADISTVTTVYFMISSRDALWAISWKTEDVRIVRLYSTDGDKH